MLLLAAASLFIAPLLMGSYTGLSRERAFFALLVSAAAAGVHIFSRLRDLAHVPHSARDTATFEAVAAGVCFVF